MNNFKTIIWLEIKVFYGYFEQNFWTFCFCLAINPYEFHTNNTLYWSYQRSQRSLPYKIKQCMAMITLFIILYPFYCHPVYSFWSPCIHYRFLLSPCVPILSLLCFWGGCCWWESPMRNTTISRKRASCIRF